MENTNSPLNDKPLRDPFYIGNFGVRSCYTDSESRRECVRTFTEQQCLDALQLPDLQRSVHKAIMRRLQQLRTGRILCGADCGDGRRCVRHAVHRGGHSPTTDERRGQ